MHPTLKDTIQNYDQVTILQKIKSIVQHWYYNKMKSFIADHALRYRGWDPKEHSPYLKVAYKIIIMGQHKVSIEQNIRVNSKFCKTNLESTI